MGRDGAGVTLIINVYDSIRYFAAVATYPTQTQLRQPFTYNLAHVHSRSVELGPWSRFRSYIEYFRSCRAEMYVTGGVVVVNIISRITRHAKCKMFCKRKIAAY